MDLRNIKLFINLVNLLLTGMNKINNNRRHFKNSDCTNLFKPLSLVGSDVQNSQVHIFLQKFCCHSKNIELKHHNYFVV